MVVPLVLAGLTAIGANSLPTIVTTYASPLCTALREKVAPAISRVVYEDTLMARQRPMGRPSPQSKLPVFALALNWIKLDELLNPDTFFHSDNPAETARMESLRERLQKVADDENNALNVLSGTMDTYDMEALAADGAAVPGVLGPASEPNVKGDFGDELSQADGTPMIAAYSGPLEGEYLKRQAKTAQDETQIYPALAPIVAQCK
ncbi:MAG TPA: hypothetical protein VMG98_09285 [Verrucomicrobiae bacterium]|nr:hypothetical protein [Verrucomicrobiae bacterium]